MARRPSSLGGLRALEAEIAHLETAIAVLRRCNDAGPAALMAKTLELSLAEMRTNYDAAHSALASERRADAQAALGDFEAATAVLQRFTAGSVALQRVAQRLEHGHPLASAAQDALHALRIAGRAQAGLQSLISELRTAA